ncbi:MAG: outer membrane beta-barrel protein [Crocinitomicaceae bacterium]|nr:outer membrane beta-barrel protein [Crocinitomicaceae bacterium]
MKNGILLIALFISGLSFGQASIYGKLNDSLSGPIPGASVMLIGAQDSILKSFAVTDGNGIFTLNKVKPGNYILKASFFGFQPYSKNVDIAEGQEAYDAGVINMQPKVLGTVTVDAQYIPIEIKGDTIEYDARAFEVKEQDMVEDLLEQLPGVEVQEDGSIKAQGKDVEKITIDGEEFFANDPTIATKNLPANAVEKVQVFDGTSEESEFTGVDDGEETTTINIKLKEDRKKGWFGNLDLAGGIDIPYQKGVIRYKGKGNVHYFKNKWQVSLIGMSNNVNETGFSFGDYMSFMGGAQNMMRNGGFDGGVGGFPLAGGADDGFLNTHSTGVNIGFRPSKQTTLTSSIFLSSFDKTYRKELERTTYFSDSTIQSNEINDQNSNNLSNRADLKFEQLFDSTHRLTFTFSGRWNQADYFTGSYLENFDGRDTLANSFSTDIRQSNFNYEVSAGLKYRKKFNKAGRFTGGGISFSQTNADFTTNLDYINSFFLGGVPLTSEVYQNQYNVENTGMISGNWMYSEPISDRMLLQFQVSHVRNTEGRDRDVFDVVSDNEVANSFLSAQADYINFTNNATLTHKFLGTKVNTTVNAKFQNLNLAGDSIFTENKSFNFILPSFQMRWDINKKADIRINYNTNVNAPSLNQLQPLPDNTNPAEIVLGNTDLIPEYRHNFNLRFKSFNEFNFTFIFASIGGSFTQNNITYSQSINEFFVRELLPENIGNETSLNGYLTYGSSLYPIKTKFNISNTANVSNGLINLNGVQDQYTSYFNSARISLENIGKKVVNLRGGFGVTYGKNVYRENELFNNSYVNYDYYVDFELFLKDRWEFRADMTHYFYPSFTTNNQIMILNTSLGLNLLESRKLQVFVAGYDLLNQNTGINQYYVQNIYEQELTQTLARYVMLGVKYSFQKLSAN